jgi:hypothetical protein
MVSKKKMLAVSLIVLSAAALIWYANSTDLIQIPSLTSSTVKADLENLYELANPGTDAQVVALQDESGLYKAVVKITNLDGGTDFAEVWVTKDGKLLTQSVILVKDSVAQMQRSMNFVQCLADEQLFIVGTLNETLSPQGAQATLLQLNLLGSFSPAIYVSCDADIQACLQANITQLPSVIFGGQVSPGFKDIQSLEQISGCRF